MSLNKKEKIYVENAFFKLNKNLDKFEKFLNENLSGKPDKIKEMVLYFEQLIESEITKEEEDEFEKEVNEYNKIDIEKLSWNERRKIKHKYKDVIKWLKEVEKASKEFKKIIEAIKKKRTEINKKVYEDYKEQYSDAEKLRIELAETIMASTELIYTNDPNTEKEVTYESLMKCTIDQLQDIMENNILELDEFLNKGRLKNE